MSVTVVLKLREAGVECPCKWCSCVGIYTNDDPRLFADQYIVQRLRKSSIPENIHICISTIQRMYSILSGEELDESAEEESLFENPAADAQKQREVVYNPSYPPEFFDCIIIDECHRSVTIHSQGKKAESRRTLP